MQLGTLVSFFLLAAALPAYLLAPRSLRVPVLIAASYAFYTFASPADGLFLAALTVAVWALGRRLRQAADEGRRDAAKRWLVAGVGGLVLVLVVFKYADFAVGSFNAIIRRATHLPALPLPAIAVPLGISFVTFMLIHYLVEMFRAEAPAPTFLQLALYASFFPTVTAGPIKRFPAFMDDLGRPGRPTLADLSYGAGRIVVGLGKKYVIADSMATLVAPMLHAGPSSHWQLVLLGVYAYAMQIYFDFAGYSDIAIGASRMFGFHVLENFDWPYIRRNIAEFWSHWHMSLTRFITEYVFIPLGGSRAARRRVALNTLAAMAVSGLWHGADWHFVAWGLYHGIGLVALRWYKEAEGRLKSRYPWLEHATRDTPLRWASLGLSVFLTFNFVAFGWVLFVLPVGEALAVWRLIASGAGHAFVRVLQHPGAVLLILKGRV